METGNRKATGLANAFSSRLNEEIRVWMTRRGENLRTLEAATGISRSRLSRTVNRDEAPINTNELDLICKALDISPSEIIGIAERAVLAQHAAAEASRPDRQNAFALAANPERRPEEDAQEADYF